MEPSGILWALQIVVGPLILGIALVYAVFHYRRGRRLQGEGAGGPRTTRDMMIYGLLVAVAVILLAFLMLIPGSR
jgi:hypothetical protein